MLERGGRAEHDQRVFAGAARGRVFGAVDRAEHLDVLRAFQLSEPVAFGAGRGQLLAQVDEVGAQVLVVVDDPVETPAVNEAERVGQVPDRTFADNDAALVGDFAVGDDDLFGPLEHTVEALLPDRAAAEAGEEAGPADRLGGVFDSE